MVNEGRKMTIKFTIGRSIDIERITDDWARKGCLYMIFNGNTVAGDFKVKPMWCLKLDRQRYHFR